MRPIVPLLACLSAFMVGCSNTATKTPPPADSTQTAESKPSWTRTSGEGLVGRWHASSKGETREEDAEIDFFLESDGTLKMLSTFKKGSVEWQGTWKASEGAKNQPEKLTIKIAKMLTLDPDGKPSEIQQDGAGSVLNCALTWKGSDEVTLTQQSGVDETGRKVEGKDSTGEVIHFVRVAR